MNTKMQNPQRLVALTAGIIAALGMFSGQAQAAQATATVPIGLPVTSPTCTVAVGAASMVIPGGTQPTLTYATWQTTNMTTAGQLSGYNTAAALNQTATVSCNAVVTTILGVIVTPGGSASLVSGDPAFQYMVDTAATPAKAFLNMYMALEQVSLNGTAAALSYATAAGALQSYTTAFNTVSVGASSSTATVVWRPAFGNATTTNQVGNPTGGTFSGSAVVTVYY